MVPPFAEEMNKARRMLILQARRLARRGVATLLIDLYGTGDSAGDFADARWDIWCEDLTTGYRWLTGQGSQRVSLLGVRFGALLALDFLRRTQNPADRVVLWQPVFSGQAMLLQFLRMRVAAAMMSNDREKESTESLRRALRDGQSIEIGGYELTPHLADAVEGLKLEDLLPRNCPPIDWIEIVADAGRGVTPATAKIIDACRQRGVNVRVQEIPGAPFWVAVEITTVPALLDATAAVLRHPQGAPV